MSDLSRHPPVAMSEKRLRKSNMQSPIDRIGQLCFVWRMSAARKFKKVLVANRGEIAVRIFRSLREMDIVPVAIFSDADRAALHVRHADEAYHVGPAPSAESYLVTERILDAAVKAKVDAIHPGYGFVSENVAFAKACEERGITFIGPPTGAIDAMGDKTRARARMIEAGVPVVPGAHVSSIDELARKADELGYPVMLKASAGGGGKGMRLVTRPQDLASGFERARSEALASFGDDNVYLEKAIVGPRHVEIQVLGDQHGELLHLYERDCSIQRRHQKVVEETPSPVGDHALISKMGEVAVRAARAVQYFSAGTIEFLVDAQKNFYFLEMNTRLQVEHPITEWVTGVDLVREQVRVAQGERLGFSQKDVTTRGHAIECRVYAEDPAAGFLPSPGRIERLRTPAGPGIRDDAGTYEGAEVSGHYDPMISKLSCWAPTREAAIARTRRALREYWVAGIATNIGFHLALMDHPDFVAGQYDTGFIEANEQALCHAELSTEARQGLAVGAALARDQSDRKAVTEQNGRAEGWSSWRLSAAPGR